MTDFEKELIEEMKMLNLNLANIHAVLNHMVVEGLVVLPDVPASDN